MNKETDMTMKLNPYFKDTLETSNVVWSHDENSYQFNFDFTNYLCDKPFELTDGKPRILLEFLNDSNADIQIYPLEIESEKLGQAHFIIPDKILGYVGDVKASLTIDFDDKSHDLGNFYFKMKKSPIDDKMPELQFWVDEFDQAFELFKHGLDEFNEDIKESNTKVDELKDLIVKNDVLKKVEAGPFEDFREWDDTIISKMKNEFAEREVNVLWFGAKGDGVNDDTTSIKNAIDFVRSHGGGTVTFPFTQHGYKIVGGNILLKSNVSLKGINYVEIFTDSKIDYDGMFKKDINKNLENVKISGFTFNQFKDTLNPNNGSTPCCPLFILGTTKNVDVEDNIFCSVGGWTIGFNDTTENHDSELINIKNNKIFFKMIGEKHYDASAIYVEAHKKIVEDNYIYSYIDDANPSFRLVGGIESHGEGIVRNNKIENATTGIHVISYKFRTTVNDKRQITGNNIINAVCPINMMSVDNNFLENVTVSNNSGTFSEMLEDTAFFGSPSAIRYEDKEKSKKSSNFDVYNNHFIYTNDNPVINSSMTIANQLGGFSFKSKVGLKNVNVYNNSLENYPGPVLVVQQLSVPGVVDEITFKENKLIDCCYKTYSEVQNAFAYVNGVRRIKVIDNELYFWNKKNMRYLLLATNENYRLDLVFKNNKQYSENGFMCETVYYQTQEYFRTMSEPKNIDIEILQTIRSQIDYKATQRKELDANTNYYANDLVFYTGTDSSVTGKGFYVTSPGTTRNFKATITRVNDFQIKVASGELKLRDMFLIIDTLFIVTAVNAENGVITVQRSNTNSPYTVPQFTGNLEVENYLPKTRNI